MLPSGAPYPSGKGAVCKTAMQRFEPARRLQTSLARADASASSYRDLALDKPLQCSHFTNIELRVGRRLINGFMVMAVVG